MVKKGEVLSVATRFTDEMQTNNYDTREQGLTDRTS